MNGRRFAGLLVFSVVASTLIAQCPPQGLTLTLTGGRLGDPAFVQVTGSPFAPGMLGFDVAPGPTVTSFGTTCLGLTSQLQLMPFTFGSNGVFAIGATVPPSPWLDGLTIFTQAVAQPGTAPNPTLPLAWSNGGAITFSSPKLVIIDPGYIAGPTSPATPGTYCIYDALADAPVTPVLTLPSVVRHAIPIPGRGLVAILLNSNVILVIDSNTGALVSTITPPTGPAGPGDPKTLASDGSSLYVVYTGYMSLLIFLPSVPGSVRSYALPSGTPGPVIQLAFGNPSIILLVPGSNVAYLPHKSPSSPSAPAHAIALAVDLAAGIALPPIDLGTGFTLEELAFFNGVVYAVVQTAITSFPPPPLPVALTAFDPTTQTPLFPSPVILPGLWDLAPQGGPGTGGLPALLFRGAFPFSVIEVSPVTLGVVNTIPLGGTVSDLDLPSGGTEWLLTLDTGTQRQLVSLVGPVLAPNVVSNLPGANPPVTELITPLSSASIRKAYLAQGASSLTPFTTDPTAALSTAVPLPLSPRTVLSN